MHKIDLNMLEHVQNINMTSFAISNINLQTESHRRIIIKLCERNNFYKEDVYAELYRDAPPNFKTDLIALDRYNKFIEDLNSKFVGLESIGYFITIEKDNRKKVIGFIIYNIVKKSHNSYLLFILIDKKYQNKGFGRSLLSKYIEDIEEKKILYSTVKIENKITANFYRKFGFQEYSDLIETKNGPYVRLHYIPHDSLAALKIIKQFYKL